MDLPGRVRDSCAFVLSHARDVRIDDAALSSFAETLLSTRPPAWDAGDFHLATGSAPSTLMQYILVLDALNFCFWPSATSAEYDALASGLRAAVLADGTALDAAKLAAATPATIASWVRAPHILPNAAERAARVREVGRVLGDRWGGLAVNLIAAARGSAAALAELVVESFPGFRDETIYVDSDGCPRPVYFYKRAQIFVGDVWTAFGKKRCLREECGVGVASGSVDSGAFFDIENLTAFADYRLPQLLRARGVLVYSDSLAAAVDALEEIPPGTPREVEIRAATVIAVERMRVLMAPGTTSVEVDHLLWHIGEGEATSGAIAPHHRTRTIFY